MIVRQIYDMMRIKLRYGRQVRHLYPEDGRVSVDFSYAPVTQLRPLRGRGLNYLGLYGTGVTQWSELAELDFHKLNAGGTSLDDLKHIRGKSLVSLEIYRTPVAALEGLEGMPLTHLQIGETRVKDFRPIASLPLDTLFMLYCEADDLSFLDGLDLRRFGFTFRPETKGMECLRRMRRLESIHCTEYDSFRPVEFWHRFENHLPLDEKCRAYAGTDE